MLYVTLNIDVACCTLSSKPFCYVERHWNLCRTSVRQSPESGKSLNDTRYTRHGGDGNTRRPRLCRFTFPDQVAIPEPVTLAKIFNVIGGYINSCQPLRAQSSDRQLWNFKIKTWQEHVLDAGVLRSTTLPTTNKLQSKLLFLLPTPSS